MNFTEMQLATGWLAAARQYYLRYDELTVTAKFQAGVLMSNWLSPCFLVLPDNSTSDAILAGVYDDEFLHVAETFLLRRYRTNALYDSYTEAEVLNRVTKEELSGTMKSLTLLTAVALEAMEGHQHSAVPPTFNSNLTIAETLERYQYIDLDAEVVKLSIDFDKFDE